MMRRNVSNYSPEYSSAALADSPSLGNLRELELGNNGLRPEGLAALCGAGWLDSLVTLSLSRNALGDEGVRELLGRLHSGTLARLNLGQANLGPAGGKALLDWPGLAEVVDLSLDGNSFGKDLADQLKRIVRGTSRSR